MTTKKAKAKTSATADPYGMTTKKAKAKAKAEADLSTARLMMRL